LTDTKAAVSLPKFCIKKAAQTGTPKSILIYGPPKKGKTVFASSIIDVPGFERVLLIDVEGGSSSVNAWHPNIDVIETPTAKEFATVIEALLNNELVEPESGLPYQAVIIDTLDKAQERQLEVYAADPKSAKDGYFRWAALKTWTAKMADYLHMAPFLTIFIAHQEDDKDETTGVVTTTVLLAGKSRFTFPSTPDIIGHFTVVTVEEDGKKAPRRVVDFTVSDKMITGQRYADKINGKFIDPTMVKIFRNIEPQRFAEDNESVTSNNKKDK
jgi:hypothetical protein